MTSDKTSCEEIVLESCPHCGRTFNPSTLVKHAAICGKMLKKRSVFDSSQQRRGGNELFNCVQVRGLKVPQPKPMVSRAPPSTSSPQLKPSTPRQSLASGVPKKPAESPGRSAPAMGTKSPGASGPQHREKALAKPCAMSPLERCPHCDRTFNRKALDNHVAWCKEKAVLASFSVGHDSDAALMAKKRMEARINYRPPTPKYKRVSYLLPKE